jgi:hypothetical protein
VSPEYLARESRRGQSLSAVGRSVTSLQSTVSLRALLRHRACAALHPDASGPMLTDCLRRSDGLARHSSQEVRYP